MLRSVHSSVQERLPALEEQAYQNKRSTCRIPLLDTLKTPKRDSKGAIPDLVSPASVFCFLAVPIVRLMIYLGYVRDRSRPETLDFEACTINSLPLCECSTAK